jgi:hypothetical protein
MNGKFAGYKTYIVAGVAVVGAVAGYLTGDLTGFQAAQTVAGALIAATLRDGITTAAKTRR